MRSFKVISFVLLAAFVTFSGCTKKESLNTNPNAIPVRVAFWGSPAEIEIITKTVTEWEKGNPNIRVILEHIPSGTYSNKILTEIAGGNAPDIIFAEANIFVTFFFKNALVNLSPYLEKDKEIDIKSFFPQVISRFTRDNKVYCIPRDVAPFACIYYNKTLFEKMGVPYPKDDWNIDQFLATAKKMTVDESGKHPGEDGFDDKKIKVFGYWGWTWQNFVYAYGGKIVDNAENPTKCLLNQPEAVAGLQMFVDMANKHFVSPKSAVLQNTGMGINDLFLFQRLAMFQSGIWETPNLRKMVGKNFEWDVAMFPKGPAGKRGFGTGGSGYAILKSCKNPDAAWEVVKCLSGSKGQEMLAQTGLAQPANMKIAVGPVWAGDMNAPKNKKMLNEAVKYIIYDPFHIRWTEANDRNVNPALENMKLGNIGVKEAMDKAVKEIDKLFVSK